MAGAEDLGWLRGLLGRFGHSQAYAEVVRDALVADGLPATAWHGELERKIADGSFGAFIAALPSPTGDGVRRLGGEAGALEATFATAGPLGMRFGSASAKDPSSPSRLQSVKPGSLAGTPPFAALRPGLHEKHQVWKEDPDLKVLHVKDFSYNAHKKSIVVVVKASVRTEIP